MADLKTVDIPIAGMDCTECTVHVQHAIAALPGVQSVNVFLASEKATLRFDPALLDLSAVSKAVADAGYRVPERGLPQPTASPMTDFGRRIGVLLAVVFAAVLFVIVIGEWLGLFARITERVPWPVGLALVIAGGYPIFRNVIRATLKRQIISHTLMTLGVIAALAVGQWATAVVVVFFMRVGNYVEGFTTERARRAVKDLTALAPRMARVLRDAAEVELPVEQVQPGDLVVVRPGEQIPVDGEVVDGQATVDQAAITGESMPVEAGPGTRVYAATIARLGSLRVRTTRVGPDTTFGRVVRMVEEAEAHRADVQRIADKFSAFYLPIVTGIAGLTFLLRRDPLATAAVLVVACSCSFALATPIAMLASIGAAAKRGLLIKGGRYLETLARADVLLIDKTGTLTLGKPHITDVVVIENQVLDIGYWPPAESPMPQTAGHVESNLQSLILQLAASAERYSEHPLAEAVRLAAAARGLALSAPDGFEAVPGLGIRAMVDGQPVWVGSRRLGPIAAEPPATARLEEQGKTLLFVWAGRGLETGPRQPALPPVSDRAEKLHLIGVLAAADTLRSEVPAALVAVRELGIRRIELLTGDNERAAAGLADQLGVAYRANLLPEDKIRIVKEYQAQGRTVVMVGDGVNDAPALAQADVGIAMGAAGSHIAIEAAHVALMHEDWSLVPEVLRIARRTMRVVKMNLGFTALYNVVGLTLAALGILPPILAAAAQSLPDLGILGNSARLLRAQTPTSAPGLRG